MDLAPLEGNYVVLQDLKCMYLMTSKSLFKNLLKALLFKLP